MRKQVLLVDDDREDRDIFLMALREAGDLFDCLTCGNGIECLKLLESGLQPHAILTDINMPMMNGFELVTNLKARPDYKQIPVFVLSTSSNPDTVKQFRQLGAEQFVTKPTSFRELVHFIQSAFRFQMAT
ncbi:MAG TPA: response regulator [Flavipsychrobacter sp.]